MNSILSELELRVYNKSHSTIGDRDAYVLARLYKFLYTALGIKQDFESFNNISDLRSMAIDHFVSNYDKVIRMPHILREFKKFKKLYKMDPRDYYESFYEYYKRSLPLTIDLHIKKFSKEFDNYFNFNWLQLSISDKDINYMRESIRNAYIRLNQGFDVKNDIIELQRYSKRIGISSMGCLRFKLGGFYSLYSIMASYYALS